MALEYGYFDSEITDYDDEGMPVFDRAKTSDFLALFYSKLISSGVLADPDNCFYVKASSGMTVSVQPGYAFVKGRFAYLEEAESLELEPASSGYSRIDLVVLRNNYPMRCCELVIKTGTPSANPKEPELVQAESGVDYYEIALAKIEVKKSATTISQSNITDTRFDSNYCGPVVQLIDSIDTSIFFEQLDAFYADFVAKSDLSYDEFMAMLSEYFDQITESGNTRLQEILEIMEEFENNSEISFKEWFENLQYILDGDVAGHLQNEIESLQLINKNLTTMVVTGRISAGEIYADGSGKVTADGRGVLVGWRLCRCNCNC